MYLFVIAARRALQITCLFVMTCGVVGCAVSSFTSEPSSSQRVAPEELTPFEPVKPMQWRLDNGLTVMVLPNNELPLVTGVLYLRGGSFWEDSLGLSPGAVIAMGDQLRQGGAGTLSADELDLTLEKLAAGISTSFGGEYGTIRFSSLASDAEQLFALTREVLTKPRFDEERLSLWKGQVIESISRRKDDPSTVAQLSFGSVLYSETPFGKVLTTAEVSNLSRDELKRAHRALVTPSRAVLAVSGAISVEEVKALVSKYLGAWQSESVDLSPLPQLDNDPQPALYVVKQPLQQASIILGHRGVPRLTDDYVAIEGFNELFGGGFGSRLFARIRTELGLSYSVGGGISPGVVRGVNSVGLQTKSQSVVTAIEEVYKIIEGVQHDLPTVGELNDIKRGIEDSFVFKFSSPEKIVERAALIQTIQYPADYDARHLPQVRSLTPEALRSVAQRRWDPRKIVIVVVGDETAYSALQEARKNEGSVLHRLPLIELTFDEKVRGIP
jgi:zinc protease